MEDAPVDRWLHHLPCPESHDLCRRVVIGYHLILASSTSERLRRGSSGERFHQVSRLAAVCGLRRARPGSWREQSVNFSNGRARLRPRVPACGHERIVEAGAAISYTNRSSRRRHRRSSSRGERYLFVGHVLDNENLEVRQIHPGLRARTDLVVVCVILDPSVPALAVKVRLHDQGPVRLVASAASRSSYRRRTAADPAGRSVPGKRGIARSARGRQATASPSRPTSRRDAAGLAPGGSMADSSRLDQVSP